MKISKCTRVINALFVLQIFVSITFAGNVFGQVKTEEQPKTPEQTKTTTQVKVQAAQVNNFVQRFDDKFLINLALKRDDSETKKMLFLSNSLTYVSYSIPVALMVGGVVRHDSEMRQNALYVGSSAAITFGTTMLMKTIFKRRRPFVQNLKIVAVYNAGSTSFPSGHTSTSFAVATALSRAYPKWYVIVPSYLWAGSVGYSRMYLGVHYPSDVFGGAVLGTTTSWLLKPAFK
ncbi:phosphatase PAP2 family protein [Mucilaginibacter sp. BJC16-A38]|uniref:phosphatase PAP2 family protein n=1 Tax=Mucilaginibacter phenanthrenivorans TaxID=1234842 RepID=UPI0021572E4A|nr:phosphatase PAP2 family protein [Mucilaginibacter phenanthrenivorans]MCR8561594.1 phosphatase PAP2 family protein [Mucilaginibacter phenanthrenivorans]